MTRFSCAAYGKPARESSWAGGQWGLRYSSGYKHVLITVSIVRPSPFLASICCTHSCLIYLSIMTFQCRGHLLSLYIVCKKQATSLPGPLSSTVIQITLLKITFLLLQRTSPKGRQKKTVYILLSSPLPKGMHPFSAVKWAWQLLYVHVRVPVWSSVIVLQPCLWLCSTHQKIPGLWSQDSLPRLRK